MTELKNCISLYAPRGSWPKRPLLPFSNPRHRGLQCASQPVLRSRVLGGRPRARCPEGGQAWNVDLYPDLYAPGCGGWGLGARQIQEWAAFVYIDLHRNSQARSRDGWGLANVAISRDSMAGTRPNQYLTVATSTHCTVGPFKSVAPPCSPFLFCFPRQLCQHTRSTWAWVVLSAHLGVQGELPADWLNILSFQRSRPKALDDAKIARWVPRRDGG